MGSGWLEAQSKQATRQILQDKGDELRKSNPYCLVDSILADIAKSQDSDVVVDGVRNDKEVERLRQLFPHFWLLAVDASRETRWTRCKNSYDGNQAQFDQDDIRDSGEEEPPYGQKVADCVHLADLVVFNNSQCRHKNEWDELFSKVEHYLKLIREPGFRRPFPRESFMTQAYVASLSSSCTRRQVGAVVVSMSDSEIVSSGFNDVPSGELTCRDLGGDGYCYRHDMIRLGLQRMKFCPQCGTNIAVDSKAETRWICPICKLKLLDGYMPGRMLDLCRALHAEEDAILQAAKLGSVSLKSCILYTTTFPCPLCAKMIVDVGIRKIVYVEPYPMPQAIEILQKAKPSAVEMEKYEGVQGRAFYKLFKSAKV
jgi:deoxycytidylate deaminase